VNVALSEGLDLSAGYNLNDYFSLSLAFEMNGQMALLEKDGKDVMFKTPALTFVIIDHLSFSGLR
jgi:hypothetical protein